MPEGHCLGVLGMPLILPRGILLGKKGEGSISGTERGKKKKKASGGSRRPSGPPPNATTGGKHRRYLILPCWKTAKYIYIHVSITHVQRDSTGSPPAITTPVSLLRAMSQPSSRPRKEAFSNLTPHFPSCRLRRHGSGGRNTSGRGGEGAVSMEMRRREAAKAARVSRGEDRGWGTEE